MVNERRLIDANAYPCQNCEISYCYKNCEKFNAWFNKTVEAVEVVHGRWILREDGYHCSRCDIQAIYTGVELKYCPNCGAKMDGERKDK